MRSICAISKITHIRFILNRLGTKIVNKKEVRKFCELYLRVKLGIEHLTNGKAKLPFVATLFHYCKIIFAISLRAALPSWHGHKG